ncbi:hypothetical protein PMG71_16875 [Roseofilum sp. BLCC_M154]|uniref:Uncharacterized protein n=1 Tax=Roseofilum acuticapitatum BLCC-M154 TaxID=3022444 RepID=A0ABT7AW12_9CYAN|nr:hypothetical protein [Roseofilum acuticapitatum]MDJ1171105.1 hypothetical protein [Roseofilum acuticapitatum BLCC-M154]
MSRSDCILSLNHVQNMSIEEFLDFLRKKSKVSIQWSEHETFVLEMKMELESLPVFEGCVPSNWKEAI